MGKSSPLVNAEVCRMARFGMKSVDRVLANDERDLATHNPDNVLTTDQIRASIIIGKEEQRLYARLIHRYCHAD